MTQAIGYIALAAGFMARARRGAVSILFAAAVIPLVTIVGLAIDMGTWNQVNASLQLAADSAAMNAAKAASVGESQNDPNYIREGYVAGELWFASAGWGDAADGDHSAAVRGRHGYQHHYRDGHL